MRRLLIVALLTLAIIAGGCAQATPTAEPTKVQPTAAAKPAEPTKASTSAPTSAPAADLSGSISVAGSTTVQPLAEKLAEAFSAKNPKVKIDVAGGGSGVGVKSAGQGTVDIGTASREVADTEMKDYPDLKVTKIAVDGVAIVVNSGVTVTGLTKQQVQDIFTGKVKNWKDVGGADKAIVVVAREEGSGTRDFVQTYFLGSNNKFVETAILQNSNGALRTAVSTTPNAIGFLSFGYLDQSVKALTIDGVAATEANVRNNTYKAWRYLNMLTKGEPKGLAKAWLDYITGPEGQQIAVKEGYLSLK